MTTFDEKINSRKQALLNRGDTLQPLIVIVGPEINNINSIYVYLDGMKYFMESLLKAVDVCFKLFHALNATYPCTGQQVWNFILRYIYHIYTDFDNIHSTQEEVATDLCIVEPELK